MRRLTAAFVISLLPIVPAIAQTGSARFGSIVPGMTVDGWTVRNVTVETNAARIELRNAEGEKVTLFVREKGTQGPFKIRGATMFYESSAKPESFLTAGQKIADMISADIGSGTLAELIERSAPSGPRPSATATGSRVDEFAGLHRGDRLGSWTVTDILAGEDVNITVRNSKAETVTFGVAPKDNQPAFVEASAFRIYYRPTAVPVDAFRPAANALVAKLNAAPHAMQQLKAVSAPKTHLTPDELKDLLQSLEGRWNVTHMRFAAGKQTPVATDAYSVLRVPVVAGAAVEEQSQDPTFRGLTVFGYNTAEAKFFMVSVDPSLRVWTGTGELQSDGTQKTVVIRPDQCGDALAITSMRVQFLSPDRQVLEIYTSAEGKPRLSDTVTYERAAAQQ